MSLHELWGNPFVRKDDFYCQALVRYEEVTPKDQPAAGFVVGTPQGDETTGVFENDALRRTPVREVTRMITELLQVRHA